jgi:protein involved in polysaccharide export with SLBB domain
MPKFVLIAALAATICSLVGCSTSAGNRYREVRIDQRQVLEANAVGPGDIIHVRVHMHKDLSGDYQISPRGQIDFPHIGMCMVEGLDPIAVGRTIRQRLAKGYIREPHVTVNVKKANSKKVFVLGQVPKPGRFPYTTNMSIVEVITLAGGFATLAERNNVIVTRSGKRVFVPVEKIMQGLAGNFLLQPDDIVFVPETIM